MHVRHDGMVHPAFVSISLCMDNDYKILYFAFFDSNKNFVALHHDFIFLSCVEVSFIKSYIFHSLLFICSTHISVFFNFKIKLSFLKAYSLNLESLHWQVFIFYWSPIINNDILYVLMNRLFERGSSVY